MEQNPYQPPRELDASAPKPVTGKQVAFWAMTVVCLPLAVTAAASALCFGGFSILFLSDAEWGPSVMLFGFGIIPAVISAVIGRVWWLALMRRKAERAMDAALPAHDEEEERGLQ